MHAQYIQVMLSCVSNISEGAAPRQWRSPRRGARRVGATNTCNPFKKRQKHIIASTRRALLDGQSTGTLLTTNE